MTAVVYEVTLGKEDGSSRTVRTEAPDETEARNAAEQLLLDGEIVIFVEEAELDDLADDDLGDHPQEAVDRVVSPSPKAGALD